MTSPAHTPSKMVAQARYPKKHTGLNGRRWNVWHRIWECPLCGDTRDNLMNTMSGKSYVCHGFKIVMKAKP